MTTTMTRPPAQQPPATRDGFGRLLRAEWTKIWSIRSTAILLLLTIGLIVPVSLLAVAGSRTSFDGPLYRDRFHFVHRPLTGDGTITVQVNSQADSQEWAKAGVMIKQSLQPGAPYAAVMVTPRHGVRWQANFALPDVAGSPAGAPRWLRLTRAGTTLTGSESADGIAWTQVGSTTLALPRTVEVGMFVTSPGVLRVVQRGNRIIGSEDATVGRAVFEDVTVRASPPAPEPPGSWRDQDIGALRGPGGGPDGFIPPVPGTASQSGGAFTVTGSGDIGGIDPAAGADADTVLNSLSGVQIGLIVIVVLGVLFATSEYKTGIIRTTFAASPRRVRVFAAKGVVLGATTFAAGLVASVAAFLVSQPVLHRNGYGPPDYPNLSLADGPVFRAVVGTALFLTAIALLSFGVGTILRRTASAITLVVAVVIVPQLIAPNLGLDAEKWINRVTPLAGLAIQETRHRFDTAIAPWAGFAVLCGYVAAVLAVAFWLLRRRDA
jgi:regulation of enolase protein 1 (concanavalin A-like superfamily)/ABC-type transport system involved in multi-copper enzyme maturation permease subunit